MEITTFVVRTRRIGGLRQLGFTVPVSVCQYEVIEEGDWLKVQVKKLRSGGK